jgi:hypothetical protein
MSEVAFFHHLRRVTVVSSPVFTLAITSVIADGTVNQWEWLTFDTLSETIHSSSGSVSPASFALCSFSRTFIHPSS